jgi:uncharacterized protein (TIGR03435 family)
MHVTSVVLALTVAGAAALAAQSAGPAFDVVSVKRNVSSSFPTGPAARPGGTFVSTNITLESIVRFAYDLPSYRIAGGPPWVRTDRFDVEARAGRDVPPDEIRRMVQTLLQDRFRLVVRREPREMALYTLVRARDDGQVGPRLRQSAAGCARPEGRGATMEERLTREGSQETRRTCAPIAALISTLSSALQSPVDDGTGLKGEWDSELLFASQRRRNVDPAVRDTTDAPALLTAVQEQLGLKLETRRGPVEVLVIESAAVPTEN